MSNVLKGYNIQIYPNQEQFSKLCSTFGCVRWLWNHFLDMQNQRYESDPNCKFLTAYSLNYILTQIKKEYPWLKEVDSTSLQKVSDDINTSFKNFFDGCSRHPRFKSKRYEQSYTSKCVNNNIWIADEHHIKLPKIGTVYYRGRLPQGKIKSATIRMKSSGKIMCSVLCETEVIDLPKTNKTIGLDMGLHDLAVLSNDKKFPLPRYDKKSEDKLAYWQRTASRRLLKAKEVMSIDSTKKLTDFSNYQKARQMVAKYHEKITNQRLDYLHKVTTWIVKNYDVICIEDLKIKGLLKNHKLARAISNASWSEFTRLLEYKCAWYGKTLIKVNPAYTSQACHVCGVVNDRVGNTRFGWLKVRDWTCPDCGTWHDRDINAAINIFNRGMLLIEE